MARRSRTPEIRRTGWTALSRAFFRIEKYTSKWSVGELKILVRLVWQVRWKRRSIGTEAVDGERLTRWKKVEKEDFEICTCSPTAHGTYSLLVAASSLFLESPHKLRRLSRHVSTGFKVKNCGIRKTGSDELQRSYHRRFDLFRPRPRSTALDPVE